MPLDRKNYYILPSVKPVTKVGNYLQITDKKYHSENILIAFSLQSSTQASIIQVYIISIRFFNDREVRAIWDETDSKWWFSVLDIVGVLNAQDDYTKNRNYWKYLKNKLKNEGSEVVSVTNQLKLLAPDFKSFIDCLPERITLKI